MPKKKFKLWLQVECIHGDNDLPEDYENLGEPVPIACSSQNEAFRVQNMLESIGAAISNHQNMTLTSDDGKVIHATETYEHCGKTENFVIERCELTDPNVNYWVAVAGLTFGVRVINGSTCIATIDAIFRELHGVGNGFKYVIWRLREITPAAAARWTKKWSARTKAGTAY